MKRFMDIAVSLTGLFIASPILLIVSFLVWVQDFKIPFYIPYRVGKNQKKFKMIKLRSMIVNADASGVDSTGANDSRITAIGHLIRKFKLDELTQLWNVLMGDMSLVGPRPNVISETNLYTDVEKKLLDVRPGITDISSIVFSDEGDILSNHDDPDLAYNQLIRPWKSRLGIIYINNQSFLLDLQLIFMTLIAILSKKKALNWISKKLMELNVDENIIEVCKRESDLLPHPPPGSKKIVEAR
ncbi:sugar transferase [Gammaproteobacteria bacterium]|nr:sugar transferase [Gammaproteobacteria bacterium]